MRRWVGWLAVMVALTVTPALAGNDRATGHQPYVLRSPCYGQNLVPHAARIVVVPPSGAVGPRDGPVTVYGHAPAERYPCACPCAPRFIVAPSG